MTRVPRWTVVFILGCVSATLAAQAGVRRPVKAVQPDAVQQAQRVIAPAAAAKGIQLTAAGAQTLAKTAIHQEVAARGTSASPVTGALSSDKVATLLAPLENSGSKPLTDKDVTSRLSTNSRQQVIATLNSDVTAHVSAAGKPLPEDVRAQVVADLTVQSDKLAQAGLSAELIRTRNDATMRALNQALQMTPTLTVPAYRAQMDAIFPKHVTLDITTTPVGAAVMADGVAIGASDIADKQFDPNPITFTFTLAGYQAAEQTYVPTAGTDTDTVQEQLVPVAVAVAPDGPPPAPVIPPDPGPTTPPPFSWTPVLVGLVVVLALAVIVLVMRKG